MPTTLFRGGRVRPMAGALLDADALLVRDGRVAALGDVAALRREAGPGAEEVDLRGATVLPGLIDTHPHLLHFGAFSAPLVDLADARDHADVVARLAAKAAETPAGEWVMATPVGEPHYFIRRSWRDLAEGTLPDRHILDRATTDHPVFLQAWAPVIPNVCVFNSAALAALGIDRTSPDRVANVWIEKDGRGEPTGRLRGSVNNYYTEDPFMNDLLRRIPMLQPQHILAGTRRAMAAYNRLGVTTVYEGHAMGEAEIGAWQLLRAEDALTVRVQTSLEAEAYGLPWTPPLSDAEFDANLARARAMRHVADDWLRHDGVTLSRGGPCWPGFIRMHTPYDGPYGDKTRGHTFVSEEKERRALAYCADTGLRLNFIGAGDRDHDEFLANAETLAAGRTRGWILQHAYLVTAEQARRYAALGMDVTTSMSFSWGKGDLFAERMGRHVWSDLIPLRRLLEAGLVVACGTDWGPKNVFEHLELAQTHRFAGSGRRNAGPAQAVGPFDALAMWTRDAARVLRWDGIGTLAPGAHADLVVVDRDPLTAPPDTLAATAILRTVVGGRVVFDAGAL